MLSNFYTDRAVYEWVPIQISENEVQIPKNAVLIDDDDDDGDNNFYVAKSYDINDPQNFDIISFSIDTKIENGKCIDVSNYFLKS